MGSTAMTLSLQERFRAKYTVDAKTGCWLWFASKDGNGYGTFRVSRDKVKRAHRVAYEWRFGPVPEGKELDHFYCDTRNCVNPEHVRPVTTRENVLRGKGEASRNLAKTHCAHGHPYDEANTYVYAAGHRLCRVCHADRVRRWRAKRKVAA